MDADGSMVGTLVRHVKAGLGVVIGIRPSRRKNARMFRLDEVLFITVAPMDEKVLWLTGLAIHFVSATAEELAEVGQSKVDELFALGKQRMEADAVNREMIRKARVSRRKQHASEHRVKPGARVLVRGPKDRNWEARVLKVNASGRIQIIGGPGTRPQWAEAGAIICCLDPLTLELPCSLSENTLDQLQERGWSQFQIGKGLQRQAYIVAFALDDVATRGDNPSREVNFDPGLGLHWRLD